MNLGAQRLFDYDANDTWLGGEEASVVLVLVLVTDKFWLTTVLVVVWLVLVRLEQAAEAAAHSVTTLPSTTCPRLP
jgi:type IV secretory pathway VirB3-like protein